MGYRIVKTPLCGVFACSPTTFGNPKAYEVQLPVCKTKRKAPVKGAFLLVAEVGFERATRLLHSAMLWCRKPGSNRYEKESHGILSPGRLPIPPFRHTASVDVYYIIARKCRFVKRFFGILSAFSDFSGRRLFFCFSVLYFMQKAMRLFVFSVV